MSYFPVVTIPNDMTINRKGVAIIPSNDDFCGDGVYTRMNRIQFVAEIANGADRYCSGIFIPNPMGIAEV